MTDRQNDFDALLARVHSLESSHRRYRAFAWVGALALCCLPLVAFTTKGAETVQAQRFELLDDKGKVRGLWGFSKKGAPTLELHDKDGIERIRVRIDGRDGPIFAILDSKKMLRGALAMDMSGLPHFTLSDAGQKPRIHMGVSASDSPAMLMIHKDGTQPVGMGVTEKGEPWVRPSPTRKAKAADGDDK